MKKNRKVPAYRPLTLESLESRLPLAGEVLLKVSGGTLTVTGTDDAQDILIAQQATAGVFQVGGNVGGTFKLNGVAYAPNTDIPGITKDIKVDLKKGNDDVTIAGLGAVNAATARNVTIKTKAGTDNVTIQGVNATGSVSVDTGGGDLDTDGDDVSMTDVKIAKSLTVTTGRGDDEFDILAGEVVGNATVKTGDGTNDVELRATTVRKNLSVTTGKGNDDVDLIDLAVTLNATIKTGNGSDDVRVGVSVGTSTYGKNLTINTGTGIKASGGQVLGSDFVDLFFTTVTGNVSITTGGAADLVFVNSSTAKRATVSTGGGDDVVNIATIVDAPVTVDQVLLTLGAGLDSVVIGSDINAAAKLVLNGPKKTKVNGGSGADTLDANGDLDGAGAVGASISAVESITL